jgi:hypothetical protein
LPFKRTEYFLIKNKTMLVKIKNSLVIVKLSFLTLLFCLFMAPLSTKAQSYGTALGIRLDGFGVTLQQQIAVHNTVELILQSGGFGKKDMILTALLEQHKGLLTQNLNFYLGGGLYKKWYDTEDAANVGFTKNPFGISPIMGLELNIGKIVLSGDIKPNIKLTGDGKALEWHTGISIRYELAGRYFKNEDWKFWKKWKKKK